MRSTTLVSVAFLALVQVFGVSAGTPTIHLAARQSSGTTEEAVQVPSSAPLLDAFRSQGCFSSSGNLTKQTLDDPNGNTDGYCNLNVCIPQGYTVSAMRGYDCFCGFVYPPRDTREEDSMCTQPCPGYPTNACGNMDPRAWSVWNTGVSIDVGYYEPPESSSTTAAPTNSATNSAGSPPQSSTTGAPADGSDGGDGNNDGGDDGPNVVAIVAGIVGGVVAIAAVAAGFWFFLRRRRNAEIEEEHRRNAAVNAFISGAKPPSSSGNISLTDSRLEPGLGARRMSDGSIADNQDYSRKILRVTNA